MQSHKQQDQAGTFILARYGPLLIYDEHPIIKYAVIEQFPLAFDTGTEIIPLRANISMHLCLLPDLIAVCQEYVNNRHEQIQEQEDILRKIAVVDQPNNDVEVNYRINVLSELKTHASMMKKGLSEISLRYPDMNFIPNLPEPEPELKLVLMRIKSQNSFSSIRYATQMPRVPIPPSGIAISRQLNHADAPFPTLSDVCYLENEVTCLGPFRLFSLRFHPQLSALDPSPYYAIRLKQVNRYLDVGLIGIAESDPAGIYQRLRVCIRTYHHVLAQAERHIRPGIYPLMLERAPVILPQWRQQYEVIKAAFHSLEIPAGQWPLPYAE